MNPESLYIPKTKELLFKTGWSQTRLAQELGVSFATVNRWLNKKNTPHSGQIQRIEQVYRHIIGITAVSAEEIDGIFSKIEKIKTKLPDIKDVLKEKAICEDFLLELTYNSDAIEGNALTKNETEAVIFDGAAIKNKTLAEHLAAVNHTALLKEIFCGEIAAPIDASLIKRIHKILMQGISDDAGQYSKKHRHIRGLAAGLTPPEDIEEEMNLFCGRVNNYKKHPIEHIAKMHAAFETVHPFSDGNGRIGRLIMDAQLIHQGYPPAVILFSEKVKYYECFEYVLNRSMSHLVYFLAASVLRAYEIIGKYYKIDK